jgi:hypothetical protein
MRAGRLVRHRPARQLRTPERHPRASEWQDVRPGDRLPITPGGGAAFTVAAAEPGHHLVLAWSGRAAGLMIDSSWSFVLLPGVRGTRLVARARATGRPRSLVRAMTVLGGGAGHVLVQRRQLVRVRRLAEQA